MDRQELIGFIGGALLILSGAGEARAQEVAYSGSLQYATGSYYFTEQTGSVYLNNNLALSGKSVSLSVTVPFIFQNTPWVSYTSSGLLPTGGPSHGMVGSDGQGSRRGRMQHLDPGNADTVNYRGSSFGDPSVSGSVYLYRSSLSRTVVKSNVSVKFPLASPESGFGTGAFDYSVGLSLALAVGSNTFVTVDGTYWMLGDMEELDFINPVGYSAGVGQSLSDGKLLVMASIYGTTRIIEGIDPPLTTGLGMNLRVSPRVSLNGNLMVGLTESSSDVGMGAGWYITL